LWNGPTGLYEDGFVSYTHAIAELIAKSGARVVIGGGDTIAVIEDSETQFGPNVFLSTGGGAMLEFLLDGTLAGGSRHSTNKNRPNFFFHCISFTFCIRTVWPELEAVAFEARDEVHMRMKYYLTGVLAIVHYEIHTVGIQRFLKCDRNDANCFHYRRPFRRRDIKDVR
jgi:hypothetical protein